MRRNERNITPVYLRADLTDVQVKRLGKGWELERTFWREFNKDFNFSEYLRSASK